MKRSLGEIWKEDNLWKVQGIGIIVGYKTQKEAIKVSSIVNYSNLLIRGSSLRK